MEIDRRDRLESFILDQNKTAIVFYLAGAGAGLAMLPFGHLSHHNLEMVLGLIGFTTIGSILRIAFGNRLSPLGIQVAFIVGWLLITVAAAVGPSLHVNFAVLYIWVTVYAALYFTPTFVVLQSGAAGVAYAVVLATSHSSVRSMIAAWTSIFGTAVILAAVVFGLVTTLRRGAREDALTGLPNRRSWDLRIDEELERAQRTRTELSVVSIDVDRFKSINDREGHVSGDRILRQLADGWRTTIRGGGDFVARLGGDEFAVLAPGSGADTIGDLVKRLSDSLSDEVTCSMGVATWNGIETSADFFRRADEAMFQVKREKKARSRELTT